MYFTGERLKKKVAEYDLGDLNDLLDAVTAGQQGWPGLMAIPCSEDYLERVRTVVYSLLHVKGIKHLFTVKLDLARSRLTIDRKDAVEKKRHGGFLMVDLPQAGQVQMENPEVPELDD